jgi:hypothetical protein
MLSSPSTILGGQAGSALANAMMLVNFAHGTILNTSIIINAETQMVSASTIATSMTMITRTTPTIATTLIGPMEATGLFPQAININLTRRLLAFIIMPQ